MYFRGVLSLLLAGVFLSTSGIFVRLLEADDPWIVLFYRSLAFSATVLVFMAIQDRTTMTKRFRALRPLDSLISISLGLGFIFYLLSLFHTTVANTVFILAAGPFVAAALGRIILKETVSTLTWIAMAMAAVGISIMVIHGVQGGHLLGMLLAFIAVIAFAVMIVVIRLRSRDGDRDSLPAALFGGLVAAMISVPMITSYRLSEWDFALAIALGVIQVGAGFILITLGARYVPAAQVPLLTLSETALAPLWVWLLVNETPARNTLIGGAVVLAAVVMQGIGGMILGRTQRQ